MLALSDALSRGRNNFDLVRLIAALAVVFGHSYVIQWPADPHDVITHLFGRESAGSLGVFSFFLLSGILISASYDRQRSIARFLVLRIARIWPALAVCSLLAAFVVGPIFTTVPLREYFTSPVTWFFVAHMLTIVKGLGWLLPGVFEHNPFPAAINAAIWTLPLELKCYLVVLGAGVLGLIGTRRGMTIACVIASLGFAFLLRHPPTFILFMDITVLQAGYSFWPVPFFLLGMLLYGWRDQVAINGVTALALVAAYIGLRDTGAGPVLFYIAFAYGVLWVGLTPALRRFVPTHDYSYGIYVYGFVIQQCLASVAPTLNHLIAFAFVLPVVFACAYASCHWVERPALDACRALLARRPRAAALPPAIDAHAS
ncbi:acyltransferase family protein [Pararobbsia silviterrae]|uniref:Acyltransferase n=1 Tax=Pararobbsia silviterrae TaxID=1792498 RepID=A0A494X808_9BURK|nr:acyltransferase [Pararobbsia silviterrae]RKP46688.1 acyltransferase [Pararobbsia silviterrae]